MAVVSKTRSRYSAWWKACLVEKAQARRVGCWLKAGGGEGGGRRPAGPLQRGGERELPPRPHGHRRWGVGVRAARDRFEPLMAPATAS